MSDDEVICNRCENVCNRCGNISYPCKHIPNTGCLWCEDDELIYEWRNKCIFCMLYENFESEEEWDHMYEVLEDIALRLVEIGFNHAYSGRVELKKFNIDGYYDGIEKLYEEGFNHGMLQRIHNQSLYYIATLELSPWLCSDMVSLVLTY